MHQTPYTPVPALQGISSFYNQFPTTALLSLITAHRKVEDPCMGPPMSVELTSQTRKPIMPIG